jgi:hypothetical protein
LLGVTTRPPPPPHAVCTVLHHLSPPPLPPGRASTPGVTNPAQDWSGGEFRNKVVLVDMVDLIWTSNMRRIGWASLLCGGCQAAPAQETRTGSLILVAAQPITQCVPMLLLSFRLSSTSVAACPRPPYSRVHLQHPAPTTLSLHALWRRGRATMCHRTLSETIRCSMDGTGAAPSGRRCQEARPVGADGTATCMQIRRTWAGRNFLAFRSELPGES